MSDIPPHVAQLTGPLLLGLCGNWGLFGCSAVQVYLYYLNFPKDSWKLKSLVYGLFIWDIMQTAMYTSTVFNSLASGWGNVVALEALGIIWFDIPFMSGVASCIVQCFYAWRIYVLGRSAPLSLFIVALALMEGAAAIALGISIKIHVQTFSDLQSKTFVVTSVWLLGSASCDVIISVCMLYLLTRARKSTSYRHTENMLSRLIRLTVGGGLLTTSVAIVDAIMYLVFQHNNYHAAPVALLAKLYTNALMVLFNSRRTHDTIHSTVNYTWDGEAPSANRAGISANSTFNRAMISVDVNVDRTSDAPPESYSMAPFNKQTEGFGSLEGESKAAPAW
ncbi:hypothetical protein EV361DRAFT_261466 [Lentinula raphanica]|uniref:DUF6534 domain-containing protein n=1 Tax=Lentinula raphanica TaxID=153919 RepID=A0AA38UHH8_9AGAR|nr:hypothetical protein C8R42DRAFT_121998 [Lentinula raphanica]KAJ3753545.1 hypothetical protein EV360DRAFT_87680 [Lentinula raphanica]KAJ3772142.1 hypothetical protein FB446DRAFT_64501 [Lentinula raphanica]KAJ3826750.1 hypothetical protein F5880DRAFT_38507 [Lentinula raphanica]KAJ3841410.1 hypothetical protein F5878DRAFT_610282 [Lentinula raphanica]